MWFALSGGGDRAVKVSGPAAEFVEATGDVASAPAAVHAVVVEWSTVLGPVAVFQRCGDRFELMWEMSGAEELRARCERPIDFEGRSGADERVRASKRPAGRV